MSESTLHGMYFEQFQPGFRLVTAGRTVTEADVVTFAGLSGDYNQIHTDAEFSKMTPFGRRVAHGLLGLSIASGLLMQTGILSGTVLAFREIREWKFIKPIFPGDTIHVEMEVGEVKALPRLQAGAVVIHLQVKNQTGETVMKGIWNTLVMSRPA
ncbi:MAG: MaoC/PaaZ C-terminal domain-containing protein [Anaerolineales bacterium]